MMLASGPGLSASVESDAKDVAARAVHDDRCAEIWCADQLAVHRVAAVEPERQRVTGCRLAVGDLGFLATGRPYGRRMAGVSGCCRCGLDANTLTSEHLGVTAGVPCWGHYKRTLTGVDGDGTVCGERAW
jgi:hypothetical protein